MTDLDLNFLLSQSAFSSDNDDDDDIRISYHRTVDDILNDSDSSSSSVSSISRSIPGKNSDFSFVDDEKSKISISDNDFNNRSRVRSLFEEKRVESSPRFSIDGRFNRLFPPLFGIGRQNVSKPGAALAAATAASRSNSAVFRLRRGGSEPHQRLLLEREDSEPSTSFIGGFESEGNHTLEVLRETEVKRIDDAANPEEDLISESVNEEHVAEQKINSDLEVIVLSDNNLEKYSSLNSKTEGNSAISASTEDDGDNINGDSENQVNGNLIGNIISKEEICVEENSTAAISHFHDKEESNFIENRKSTNETCLMTNLVTDISFSEDQKTNLIAKNDNCLNEQSITMFLSSEDPEKVTDDHNKSYSSTADKISFSEDLIVENVKNESQSMKSLQFAEEIEKKQASTGFHLEKGAVALPMRLEGGKNISSVVGYFDIDSANVMTHIISSESFRQNYGFPSSFAVHPSFVAIGMSKGVIVIHNICSTHSTNDPNTEVTMLGLQGDKTHSPITSIHFNKQGDLLLAGYGDGHVTFWDVQRRSPIKVITGEHSVAVEQTVFFGQDSQNTKQFKALSTDSKGLVLLHTISVSVVPLRNRFSIKTLRFREERIGVVLSVSPLTCDEFSSDISAMPSGTSGVISTASLSSLMGGVVGVDSGWKLFGESPSLGEENIILLVMFPSALMFQLSPTFEVCAQLPKPEGVHNAVVPCISWRYLLHNKTDADEKFTANRSDSELMLAITWEKIVQVAKLVKSDVNICNEWTLEESAIGVAWLDDQMLVVLTSSYQLYLFTVNGYLVYKTCYSLDEHLLHTNMDNIHINAEKTYNNVLLVSGSTIFVLGSMFLVVCRLLSWKERIQVLRKSGDWMSALNMGMTIFDGDAHGIIDLPKSKNALQEVVTDYLVELLLCYVDESISYISVMSENQMENINKLLDSDVSGSYLEAKEQFSHVGGVVVEFCVHLKKTDILYDEVFTKFISAGHKDTFLELLEPYILKDMLGSLPPEIMQALVEHYNSKGWLQRVEQCILHMDIASVDFNQVVKLCREHGLYGALIYLFNRGLDDFKAPLEELLLLVRNSPPDSASALGYKILVYLKYCFMGLTFPPGHGMLNPSRIPSLRMELLLFLLEDTNIEISETPLTSNKNIYNLLLLNTEATLDVLKCAFLQDEVPENGVGGDKEQGNLLVQSTVDTLVGVLTEPMSADDKVGIGVFEWPSEEERGYLLDFIAYCVSCRGASVSKCIVSEMVKHLTRDVYDGNGNMYLKHSGRQRQLLAVLDVIPKDTWEETVVLHLCEKAKFFQVSGFVHSCEKRYVSALDSYMKEEEEPAHSFIFINRTLSILHQNECAAFRSEVVSRIPDLINLNREGAYFMIAENFSKETQTSIISKLESYPKSLFLYLKTVIELYSSDKLNFSSLKKSVIPDGSTRDELESYFKWIENLAKISWNNSVSLTDDIVNLYLELLCQYEQESVLGFLQRFERYQIEKCLRICLKYEVADACAFLLERVGDIGRALSFTLSCLNTQFKALDRAVANVISDDVSSGFHSGMSEQNPLLQLKEVNNINDTLNTCIGLCQRNTPRMDPDETEFLWFSLLNAFCAPMTDADNSETEIIAWKIPKAEGADIDAHSVLRNMFSHFLKQIVEGMTGYVPLPLIVTKLLYRKGGHELGDFRTALSGMLYSYGFERRILETVKLLIEDDMFFTVSTLKKGASHGYSPPLMQCSVCNLFIASPSPASHIQIFGCGHLAHVNCNASGNRASTVGCPLCVPKKKSRASKEKHVLTDDGLVSGPSAAGVTSHLNTGLYPHDSNEMLDNSYRNQHMSRYDVLCELWKEEREGGILRRSKPQLRLSPPPIYHDKVISSSVLTKARSSRKDTEVEGTSALNKPPKSRRTSTLSSFNLPLKTTIFGK